MLTKSILKNVCRWAICLGLFCLQPSLLQAAAGAEDARQDTISRIVSAYPTPCLDDAISLRRKHDRNVFAQSALALAGTAGNLGPDWKSGNKYYNSAYVKLIDLVSEHNQNIGAFAYSGFQPYLAALLSEGSDEELAELGGYIASDKGKLFWDSVFEGTMCLSILQFVNASKHLPQADLDYASERGLAVAKLREEAMEKIVDLQDDEFHEFKNKVVLFTTIKKRFDGKQQSEPAASKELYEAAARLIEPEIRGFRESTAACCEKETEQKVQALPSNGGAD